MSPLLRRLRDILVLAAVYVVTAYAGFRAAQVHPVVAAIWPAAGLAVGALAWLGPSRWPAIALGAFAANALAGIPLAGAAGIGIGNTLEALLALWLLRRAGFKPALDRVRDLVAFIGLAAGAAPLAGAAIGIASLHLSGAAGPGGSLGVLWLAWWSGDAIGILVVAPLFLVWLAAREASRPTPGGFRTGAMVILLLAAFSIYLFGREAESGYLVLGAATWTAYLLGLHGATVSTLVVAAIASIFTILKLPGGPSPEDTLVALKLFLAVLSVSGLGVAVLAAGRASAAAKFEGIVNNADEAIVAVTADQRIMLFNHGAERIFGIAAMDAMGRPLDILLPDRFVPGHRREVEEFLASGGPRGEWVPGPGSSAGGRTGRNSPPWRRSSGCPPTAAAA